MPCSFVPPYLLERLAATGDQALGLLGHSTLAVDERMRARRAAGPMLPRAIRAPSGRWVIHDAGNTEDLPGRVVRRDTEPASGDPAVDEAWESSRAVWDLFEVEFDRRGVDGEGTPLSVTVHYGTDYDNAFWDGRQLVFGDGDGVVFERFTKSPDVLAHEFTHGVIQFSANLDYQDQSGALNESVADVFAALTTQRTAGQAVTDADWLIGVGLFRPGINARALRSMLEPGTAYDDPQVGRDPQVGSLADYVETEDDNGGVHINSGIPNRAFALAATALGGFSWERTGRCWYDALTAGEVSERTDFAGFAHATVSSARRLFPDDPGVADAIESAWVEVGVLTGGGGLAAAGESGPEPAAAQRVAVRRSGGFAGMVRTAELDLAASPAGEEVRSLLDRVDPAQLSGQPPVPDAFVYTVEYGQIRMRVFQENLTPELHRVIDIVLDQGQPRDLD